MLQTDKHMRELPFDVVGYAELILNDMMSGYS